MKYRKLTDQKPICTNKNQEFLIKLTDEPHPMLPKKYGPLLETVLFHQPLITLKSKHIGILISIFYQ